INLALETASDSLDGTNLSDFSDIKLHYLDGHIQLEIWRDLPADNRLLPEPSSEELIRKLLMKTEYISGVDFVYRHTGKCSTF
ncbi:MAG: hypothetical protein GY726_14025, partial [Proteobacteria bacterium]|nr:hypothetical protein [Pseudomonadota bacterium]